jgi:hypothetical protein
MERKFKQQWLKVPSISKKLTNASHLKSFDTKKASTYTYGSLCLKGKLQSVEQLL